MRSSVAGPDSRNLLRLDTLTDNEIVEVIVIGFGSMTGFAKNNISPKICSEKDLRCYLQLS